MYTLKQMRPRFGIRGSANNEILSSLPRREHAERLKKEMMMKRRLRENQMFAWDEEPTRYNDADDDELAGITELGVLTSDGYVDKTIDGPVVIGGREHQMKEGRMRIISKQAVDETMGPIFQERAFKDSIMSAILADRSGRICRMMLPKRNYQLLTSNASAADFQGVLGMKVAPPRKILDIDARPEYFTMYHESSSEWALAVQKLSLVIDNTSIAYDGDISDWLGAYGKLRSNAPASI